VFVSSNFQEELSGQWQSGPGTQGSQTNLSAELADEGIDAPDLRARPALLVCIGPDIHG